MYSGQADKMAKKEKLYKDLPRPKLTRAQIEEIYRRLSIERPAPEDRAQLCEPLYAGGRGRSISPSHGYWSE